MTSFRSPSLRVIYRWYFVHLMSKTLSACGIICEECHFHGKECKGCDEIKGKIFWAIHVSKRGVCPIYECAVERKKYSNCAECIDLPCKIYFAIKDPSMTDEEHKKGIERRVGRLIKTRKGGKHPHIDALLSNLSAKKAKLKYSSANKLVSIAEKEPSTLYPHLDFFAKLLDNENQTLKWIAIRIIGRLSKVDEEGKIDKLLKRLITLSNCGKLITANNAILALGEIARNKPKLKKKIIKELLKVEGYKYDTDECANIAIGKVIETLGNFKGDLEGDKDVIAFLKRQTKNTRNATSKKAKQLLKNLDVNASR
jgi:hypothetical protein